MSLADPIADIRDPEVALAIAHAPIAARNGLRALWALDARIAEAVRAAVEPMMAEIRLTWWRDALAELGQGRAPEPLLEVLAGLDIDGEALSDLPEGWIVLLDPPPLAEPALLRYGRERGGSLFGQAARLLGRPDFAPLVDAGAGWALVDLGHGSSDHGMAVRARAVAAPLLARATAVKWPRELRPLGMLAHLAARDADADKREQGAPARIFRMLRHRLSGR